MASIKAKMRIDLTDSVYKAASQAFREYVAKIGDQFQDEIESQTWTWTPGVTTRRRNGIPVTSPRDIVDTGQLRDSQQKPVISSDLYGFSATINWTAPYAEIVLNGPKGFNGASYPARNWIESGMKKLDMEKFIKGRLK